MLIDIIFRAEEFLMYRNALGLTEQQVADEFGVSKQTINNFEHNRFESIASAQYFTLGILILWENVPDDEKEWRLECGKAGINVGAKRNEKAVKYIKEHMN